MHTSNKHLLLASLIALLAVFLFVGSVSADDGSTPVPTAQATDVASATDTTSATNVAEATDVVLATEAASATPTPAATETMEVTATPAATLEEISSPEASAAGADTPTETPTAAVAAPADAVATSTAATGTIAGDPYFTVGAIKYAFVTNLANCPSGTTAGSTCNQSATPISAAINYIKNNGVIPTDKKIYVESGTYNEQQVMIDGTSNVALSQLQGLIGVYGSGSTIINGNVVVEGAAGGFTLSGFTINGAVVFTDNKGTITLNDLNVTDPLGNGVSITYQNGAVALTNVSSSGNSRSGAIIDNSTYAGVFPVTVTNSEFNDNGNSSPNSYQDGIEIWSNGTVAIDGISASRNTGSGMYIQSKSAISVSDSVFSDNTSSSTSVTGLGLGLQISNTAPATISLTNILADGNSEVGILLNTNGSINASQVISTDNGDMGLYIGSDLTPASVLVADSIFSNNGSTGLEVEATGNITLSFVSADDNLGGGAFLDNCQYVSGTGKCAGSGTVTLLNPNLVSATFSGNTWDGLYIVSNGAVAIKGVSAIGNKSGDGLYIRNNYSGGTGSITISTFAGNFTTDWSQFSSNSENGVEILTNGLVVISGQTRSLIEASSNGGYGFKIGDLSSPIPGSAALAELTATSNSSTGVLVVSKGSILLVDVAVSYSTNSSSSTVNGIQLNNVAGSGNVTVTGGSADHNKSYGYYIVSNGVIILANAEANFNGIDGVSLDNTNVKGKAITLSSVTADSNTSDGFDIFSNGVVTLTSVVADSNTVMGADINNRGLAAAMAVTITGSDFSSNVQGNGLVVETLGAVTFKNITADGNGISGVNIENCGYLSSSKICMGKAAIIITGTSNSFSNNGQKTSGSKGLYIITIGPVTLNNIEASNNGTNGSGVYIQSPVLAFQITGGSVALTLTPTSTFTLNIFDRDSLYGIYVQTYGLVDLKGFSSLCSGTGVYIDNRYAASAVPVTLTFGIEDNSSSDGVKILSKGLVKVTDVESDENDGNGLYIDNSTGVADVNVLGSTGYDYYCNVSTTAGYCMNLNDGLKVISNGNVIITNVTANSNTVTGIAISTPKAVTLSSLSISNSGADGLDVTSTGIISLFKVTSNNNDGYGADLENTNSSSTQTLTISTSVFSYNRSGLKIFNNGPVTLQGLVMSNNYDRGETVSTWNGHTIQGYVGSDCSTVGNVTTCDDGSASWTFTNSTSQSEAIKFTADFSGTLTIKNSSGTVVYTSAFSNSSALTKSLTLATGKFTATITAGDQQWGNYKLSFNDSNRASVLNYDTGGISINDNDSIGNGDIKLILVYTDHNSGDGLDAWTNGGVSASGVYISTCGGTGIFINTEAGGKTATFTNVYVDAKEYTIKLFTSGPVVWTNVRGDGDATGDGAILSNEYAPYTNGSTVHPITITNGSFSNNLGGGSDGIDIYSDGTVTLTNVSANNNNEHGINIDNTDCGAGVGNVIINTTTGTTLNDNGINGLLVNSYGTIKLTGTALQAIGNGINGVILVNDQSTASAGVTVLGAYYPNAQLYTYIFSNNFYGLEIYSKGAVVIGNILATDNGASAIVIGTDNGTSNPSSVTGFNLEATNSGSSTSLTKPADSISIFAAGPVKVTTVWAFSNNGGGLAISNDTAATPSTITVKQGNFSGSNGIGLYLYSHGNVTVDSVLANNDTEGLYMGTCGTMTLLGTLFTNQFNNSTSATGQAIGIFDNGDISLSNFTANNNAGTGLKIYSGGKLTISQATLIKNAQSGLDLGPGSDTSLTNVNSSYNGRTGSSFTEADGIKIDPTSGTVTFNNCSFVGNTASGIEVIGASNVFLTATNYYGNDSNKSGDKNYYSHA